MTNVTANVSGAAAAARSARAQHAESAIDLSDFARSLVPTAGDARAHPGAHISAARQARVRALRLLERAVVLELALGRSWAQVAAAAGLPEVEVRARWEADWIEYQASDHEVDADVATRIDRWYALRSSEVERRMSGGGPQAFSDHL